MLRLTEMQRTAQASSRTEEKTAILWKLESLAAFFLRTATSENTLNDNRLPPEIRPISHSGMGVAAVEKGHFDAEKISRIIDTFSHPDYRHFAYESVGAMLAVYQPGPFHWTARTLSRLGVFRMPRLHPPRNVPRFLSQFAPDLQPLISHGFGRLLYFRNHTLAAAIRQAQRTDFQCEAAVRGCAFAFAMVNSQELEQVLISGSLVRPLAVREAFENGLVYALIFWEWLAPGFLSRLNSSRDASSQLLARAKRQIALNRDLGSLRAFELID